MKGKLGYSCTVENEEFIWNGGDSLRCLMVLSCPVIKFNEKLINRGRTNKDIAYFKMKALMISQGRNYHQLRGLLRAKGLRNGWSRRS